MLLRSASAAAGLLLLMVSAAWAAYFHETHRADALLLSHRDLKTGFRISAPPSTAELSAIDASVILAVPGPVGLFEEDHGRRVRVERCGENGPKARACEREWEAKRLAKSKGAAVRKRSALTLKSAAGPTLTLRDWNTCASRGGCDGERFLYLGPVGRSAYLGVQIAYGHDAPSLVLFHAASGKLAAVHYGSEPTFLHPTSALLVNSEDLNDATSLLVTSLAGDAPALDLQCLGTRTPDTWFGVTFKRWIPDATFDVVLTQHRRGATAPERIPVRFVRAEGGAWTVQAPLDLAARGFACRARDSQ